MAKVNMKRYRHEDSGTLANTPEKTVHIMEPRATDPVKSDLSTPEIGHESASASEVIDADWVEMSKVSTASTPPASKAGVSPARIRMAREKPSEFSVVTYVLLFFSAALLSALVMLAVMGQA